MAVEYSDLGTLEASDSRLDSETVQDRNTNPADSIDKSIASISSTESSTDDNLNDNDNNAENETSSLPEDIEYNEADSQDLIEKKLLIRELMNSPAKEGDIWYLIPSDFLYAILNSPSSSFIQLKNQLGPVNCTSIVDENGNLYPENNEPVGTYNIPPQLLHRLIDWFGIIGDAVPRSIIANPSTGDTEIERYPPCFILHTLSKTNSTRSHHNQYLHHGSISGVTFSQTKTFAELLDAIRVYIFKVPSKTIKFRVWFIESPNIEDFSNTISIASLIHEIPKKSLVLQSILNDTLKSQGVGNSPRLHLLVESLDKATRKFPVDNYLTSFDYDKLDINSTLSTGGNLGLANLGNTCYMNSALQCLLHVSEINHYFFFNLFERELNQTNPLGNKGDVAVTFGALLHKLFDNSNSSQSAVSPREFKHTIGRYSSLFQGYQQQDSQEFLSWLLDALHEDLNRIYHKPYCEKPELKDEDIENPSAIIDLALTCWDQHKQRNDSIIVDLFTGMYQSTLVCPDCSKTSITFDPFNDLTLPLPISKKWYHTFTIINLSPEHFEYGDPIMKFEVELNKTSNYDDLLKYLSKFLKVPTNYIFLFEIFRNYFYKDFQESYNHIKFFPISEIISDGDDILVYIIPHDPEADIIVPVLNTVPDIDKTYNLIEAFGLPLFVVLNKTEEVNSFGSIRSKLEQCVKILSRGNIEQQYNELKDNNNNDKYYSKEDFPLLNSTKTSHSVDLDDDLVFVGEDDSSRDSDEVAKSAKIYGFGDTKNISNFDSDDGYDSDISLANPKIGGNFAFEVKYYYEDNTKPTHSRGFNRFNSYKSSSSSSSDDSSNQVLRIPHGRPNFTNLPSLASQLPVLKRNYYHYPEFASTLEQEIQEMTDQVNENLSSDKTYEAATGDIKTQDKHSDEFVIVNKDNDNSMFNNNNNILDSDVEIPSMKASSTTSQHLLDEEGDNESDGNLGQVGSLFDSAPTLGPPPAPTYSDSVQDSVENSPINDLADSKSDNHPILVDKNTTLVCEWDPQIHEIFFKNSDVQSWENLNYIPNSQLKLNKERLARQQKSTISLYDCLKSFSTPEVLGDQDLWYCPRCKDHKQATKTIQIWSTGDILTIHLKRFQSARSFSDKIDVIVDFPIEGLDMSPFVSSKKVEAQMDTIDGDLPLQIQKNDLIYDLFAVDNHYGGLGGGHYTASAKNFRDNKWYYFNDGRVTSITDPTECITGAAYLLFYRKRSVGDTFVGGQKVNDVINDGRQEYEKLLSDFKNRLISIKSQAELYDALEQEEIKRLKEKQAELEQKLLLENEDETANEEKTDHDKEEILGNEITTTNEFGQAERIAARSSADAEKEEDYDEASSKTSNSDSSSTSSSPSENTLLSVTSTKKSRSPINENDINFETNDTNDHFNKRKQRLISREKNINKSIHIVNPSASSSNLHSSSNVTSPSSTSGADD